MTREKVKQNSKDESVFTSEAPFRGFGGYTSS